jgi:hypothetical protein
MRSHKTFNSPILTQTGTKDYTAYLAMLDALHFRESIGGDAAIMPYIRSLAWQGGQILSKAFGNTITMASQDMTSGMVDVQLPTWANETLLANLTMDLAARRNTFVYELCCFWTCIKPLFLLFFLLFFSSSSSSSFLCSSCLFDLFWQSELPLHSPRRY